MSSSANLQIRVKQMWTGLGLMQRWLAGGMLVALVLAVSLGVYLNRPDWVVLVRQADPKDAAAIVARLQELKVPYRPTGDGYTIEVPKTEQYTAKLALAQAGLPKGTSVGMELFDQPKFGATEFDRKVNYLRAQQGELEKALMRMSDLEYANVKLAIPERTVFVRDQQPVTAAVLVQPRSGRVLSPDQVSGIVNFVSGSVQGLMVDNVKVVDQSGRLLSNGLVGQADGGLGMDPDHLKRQNELQMKVEDRVQSLLEPIFGKGNVVARVNLELNLEASRIENQMVGGSTPKTTETTREAVSGKRTTSPIPAGPSDPNAPPVYRGDSGTNDGSDQWKTKTTTDYAVSQTKETKLIPPGAVKRLSVGIAVNQPSMSAETIIRIKDTVANTTGADTASISVLAMSFNKEQAQTPAPTSPPAFQLQPATLAVGLGAAAVVLLAGFFMLRRRREDLDLALEFEPFQPGLSTAAVGAGTGSTLDVALGLEPALVPKGTGPDGSPPPLGGPVPQQPPAEEMPPMVQTPRQNLEAVMAAKPQLAMVLGGHPPDEALMGVVDDLVKSSPKACAEPLRQWLKGGT